MSDTGVERANNEQWPSVNAGGQEISEAEDCGNGICSNMLLQFGSVEEFKRGHVPLSQPPSHLSNVVTGSRLPVAAPPTGRTYR